MDKTRKKELQEQYKDYHPPMGLLVIRNRQDGRFALMSSQNLPGSMNSVRFQLNLGSYPNQALQRAWQAQGQEQFIFEIVEELSYDEDDEGRDYRPDLQVLEELYWAGLSEEEQGKRY